MKKEQTKKQGKAQVKHWNEKQKISHAFGLIILAKRLQQNKKQNRLFVQLMKFTNKTSIQNRTHHEKMIKLFRKEACPVYFFLYHFYFEKFIIRHLDEQQLKKELIIFIRNLNIDQEGEKEMVKTAMSNLKWLELDKNVRAWKQRVRNEALVTNQDPTVQSSQPGTQLDDADAASHPKYTQLGPVEVFEHNESISYQQNIGYSEAAQEFNYSLKILPQKIREEQVESAYLSQPKLLEENIRFIKQNHSQMQYDYLQDNSPSVQQSCFGEYEI